MPLLPSEAAAARSMKPVQPAFSRAAPITRRMRWMNRLQHPFALVAQGFVLGGILFFATHPSSLQARASDPGPAPLAIEAAR